MKIYDSIEETLSSVDDKVKSLREVKGKIHQLLEIYRQTVCQTERDEKDFIVFTFILWRSIYECLIMIEIAGKKGSDSVFLTHTKVSEIQKKTIEEYKAGFCMGFKPEN